jgi:predicted nuclease with TOPRIM domain
MDSDSSSFPQPLEEIDKMIKRSGFWPMTKDLVSIKTSLAVVHKRHEEILKEKEEKILALQYKLSNQQSKEAELAKEIAELKEENADLKNWADRRNPDYKGLLYNLNEAEMALTSQNNVSKTLAEDLELIELQIKDMKRRAMRMAGDLVAAANKLSEAKPMAEAAPRRRRRSRYVLSESPDEFESVLSSKMSGDGCPSAKKDMSQKSEESPRGVFFFHAESLPISKQSWGLIF